MAIKGPRLADSDAAQAYLADMANRPQFRMEAISGALDGLAELPVGRWRPAGENWDDEMAQCRAVGEVYVRGVLACGLVVDRATGREDFYQARDFAVREKRVEFVEAEPSLGLLLRVLDTLTAARVVYTVMDNHAYGPEFAPGHAAELLRLTEAAQAAATARLAACREGGSGE